MTESKELVNKESTDVVATNFAEELGIDMQDITIGRISVMQSMSQLVQQETAKVGDIVNLLTGNVIGGKKNHAEIIIVGKPFWYWIEKEGDNFLGRHAGKLPEGKPFQEGSISRMEHQSFYILLADELKEGFAMPLELSFRSSSMKTARKLCSFLVKLYMMQKPTWAKVFNLTSLMSSKDKYTWYIPEIAVGRDTTTEESDVAKTWVNTLKSATSVVHTEEEQMVASPNTNGVVHEDNNDPGQF